MPTMVSNYPDPSPKRSTGRREEQLFTLSTFTTPSQVAQVPTHYQIQDAYCETESSCCLPSHNKHSMETSSSSRFSISNISPTTLQPSRHPRPTSSKSISGSTMSTTTTLHKRRKTSISSLSLFKRPFRFSLSKAKPRQLSTECPTTQRKRRESTTSTISIPASTSTCSQASEPISPSTTSSLEPHRSNSTNKFLRPIFIENICQDETIYGFPFGHPLPEHSTRGRDLGSVSSRIPPTPHSFDAHPGTLVTSLYLPEPETTEVYIEIPIPIDACSPTTSDDSNNSVIENQSPSTSYHAYLRSTTRSKCASTNITRSTTATTTTTITSIRTSRPENISYQDAKLERRARSISTREQELREGTSGSTSTSSHSSTSSPNAHSSSPNASRPRNPSTTSCTSSTSGHSTISLEDFLVQIRTSVDQSRSRSQEGGSRMGAQYDIFVDEVERGFIGEEPL